MMRSGNLTRPGVPAGWVISVVIATALLLSLLLSYAPLLLVLGGLCAFLLLIVLLQRPDLGLMIVLFIRSFTDLSIARAPWHTRLPPGSILSSPVNVGLIVILIFAGGVFLLSRGGPFLRLPGGTPFTVLILIGLIGLARAAAVVHSEGILYGLSQWLRPVSALVVYALAAHVFRSKKRIHSAVDALAAAFVIPGVLGCVQLAAGNVVRGTFEEQNAFGVFLTFIFAVFLCQALALSGIRRLLAVAIVGASGLLLAATFSRSGWAGALAVLLVVGALRKRALLFLVPVVAILAVGMIPSISNRLEDPFGGSFAYRTILWRTTAPAWVTETRDDAGALSTAVNRLIGTGPGSVAFLTLRGFGQTNMAHDDYLAMLFEYGLVGLAAYLLTYLAMLISAYRTWRRCSDARVGAVALSFVAVTLGFMVMSLTENVFGLTQNQIYFWTLAGLTVAIDQLAVRPQRDRSVVERESIAPARMVGSQSAALLMYTSDDQN